MKNEFKYVGDELTLFAKAVHWKAYVFQKVRAYISGDVLEVGAGIGETTRFLSKAGHKSWLCLEPDGEFLHELEKRLQSWSQDTTVTCKKGFLSDLSTDQYQFDTILYIDVLEHIDNDKMELTDAAKHLKPKGRLIVISPAHQCLFTPFDAGIGHYRRYNKKSFSATVPADLEIRKLLYLDCVGLFASLANKMFLKQQLPSLQQIMTWDNILIPLSKLIDPLTGNHFGKTLLAVCEKTENNPNDYRKDK